MNKKIILGIIVITYAVFSAFSQEQYDPADINSSDDWEENNWDKKTLNFFAKIEKFYPEFLSFFESSSFSIHYNRQNRSVNYYFDFGTAFRGYGSYYVIDDDNVIHIMYSVGTTAYSYTLYKNGIIIDEGTFRHDFYFPIE